MSGYKRKTSNNAGERCADEDIANFQLSQYKRCAVRRFKYVPPFLISCRIEMVYACDCLCLAVHANCRGMLLVDIREMYMDKASVSLNLSFYATFMHLRNSTLMVGS